MRMTICIGDTPTMFACFELILAVPDIQKVAAGEDTAPVGTILNNALVSGSVVVL